MGEECRSTPAYDGFAYAYAGVDTGTLFHQVSALNAVSGGYVRPFYGDNYWVGSAALCAAGYAYVGNDDSIFRVME